jgi:hypothetical protein
LRVYIITVCQLEERGCGTLRPVVARNFGRRVAVVSTAFLSLLIEYPLFEHNLEARFTPQFRRLEVRIQMKTLALSILCLTSVARAEDFKAINGSE